MSSLFLVFYAFASLAIFQDVKVKASPGGEFSHESMNILKKVFADIKGELTSGCVRSAMFLMKNARSDHVVANRCDYVKTFGKAMMRSTCKDLDMKKMEAAMCGTEWPVNKITVDFNSDLSEKAVTVLQNILNDLTSLGDSCLGFFKKAAERAHSDNEVFNMCDLISSSRVRKGSAKYCSSSEYDTLKESTCGEIEHFQMDEKMYSLSTEAAGILDTIKDNMEKVMSHQCKPMMAIVTAVANSNKEIYGLCHLMKSEAGFATMTRVCSVKDYEKMIGVICDELEEKKKIFGVVTFNTNLSDEAVKKFQHILDRVYGMAEGCTTFLTSVAQRINDDSQVDSLCGMMSGPAKPKMLESCSQHEYKMFQQSACHA